MTDITVKFDPGSGAATIELRGATIVEARFRLRDTATEKYLTRRGWSKAASYLPAEATIADDVVSLQVDADLARRIPVGTNLSLEQPASNLFASLIWPAATIIAAVEPDVAETDEAGRDEDAPTSLEPAIREEAILPFHVPDVATSGTPVGEDDEEEDSGRSWGLVAAAAVTFLVLGSLLTYFWQSSAYESDLRTAMRAVEAQRDQEKAEFDKRLAEVQSNAGKVPADTVTTANTEIASLTDQTAALTRDRDAARKALADQQTTVKDLEQRLATASGEVETLKAAQEADANEQSAVFNDRIAALGKELDKARQDLTAARGELTERDQAIAKAGSDLEAANAEITALKKASEDQNASRNEELEGRIKSLSTGLDKATLELANRDKELRDLQARLSVADVQIEALKKVANKATETDLERSTLADRISQLTTQLEEADKAFAAKEQELGKAKTSLETANTLLTSKDEQLAKLAEQKPAGPAENPVPGEQSSRLQQERDIYANELKSMTESFTALKAEKDKLTETVKNLEEQVAGIDPSAAGSSENRAIWGSTAIDRTGAVYSLQNQIAEKTASDNVVSMCRGKSQAGCEALRTYSNACFSLARIEGEGPRNDNFGFSVNKDWKAAESGAVRQCEELGANCTVRFTVCSPDVLSKPAVNQ